MTRWVGSSHSSHYPVKFVDLVPCERQNIRDLSRDHPIEVSRDFVEGFPSSKFKPLLGLGSIHCMEVWKYNVFYLSRDHHVEVSRDSVGL